MKNPIKAWFFELIEDAIGSQAMDKFKEEENSHIKSKGIKENIDNTER